MYGYSICICTCRTLYLHRLDPIRCDFEVRYPNDLKPDNSKLQKQDEEQNAG